MVINDVHVDKPNGQFVIIAFDLLAAFDTADNALLLQMMHSMGSPQSLNFPSIFDPSFLVSGN